MLKQLKQELKSLSQILAGPRPMRSNAKTFSRTRQQYIQAKTDYEKTLKANIVVKIQKLGLQLSNNITPDNPDNDKLIEIVRLVKVRDKIAQNLRRLLEVCGQMHDANTQETSMPKLHSKLPSTIKGEVACDIAEAEKCLASGCYRAAVILCGRIMETCLHRKYYDETGFDLLEKSPGMGLGKLIAKMAEKNIKVDPGLTQQIHLINQVRIYTVHKKSECFAPSKAQAQAIVLYTLDTIERLFK